MCGHDGTGWERLRPSDMAGDKTGSVRAAATCVLAVLAMTVTACAADPTVSTTVEAECTPQLRLGDVVYTSYGYTDRQPKKFATADKADCHDVGRDAPGSVFPDDPRQVVVWAFRGYPAEKVLGVRFDATSFAVHVAESVPRAEGNRIFRELQEAAK